MLDVVATALRESDSVIHQVDVLPADEGDPRELGVTDQQGAEWFVRVERA